MPTVFLTSDLHFQQQNFCEYSEKFRYTMRPLFSTAEESDSDIITRFNNIVPKDSTVYFLGDIANNATGLAKVAQMNGKRKILIAGNHDVKFRTRKLLDFFDEIYGVCFLLGANNQHYILSHMPVHPEELARKNSINLHGHLHKDKVGLPEYVNCCVDYAKNNYSPLTLEIK